MSENYIVRPVTAEEVYPVRHRVLRPHMTIEDCKFPLDKSEGALHAGCFADDVLVGIGTIFREDQEGKTDREVWRIRGMAVVPEFQGKGIGGKVLEAMIKYAEEQSPTGEIWCNGRAGVKGFYQRYGFEQVGDMFDMPNIGPHYVMEKKLGR